MAFADPQTVTINAVAQSMPRTSSGNNSGAFRTADGLVQLTLSHRYAKGRANRLIRLDHAKTAADPFLAGTNVRYNGSVWLVTDFPSDYGYTLTEAKQVVDGFTAYLTASSGANITKLLGGES